MDKPWQNAEGYPDFTAYQGQNAIAKEDQRVAELIKHIRYVVRLAGFEMLNRVEYRYRDYQTGVKVTVRRCQCRECGRIDYIHFDGKNIYYRFRGTV